MSEQSTFADRLAAIEARIAAAATRAGRSPDDIRLLPVSKTMPVAAIREAHAAGLRRFGENQVQEALSKYEALTGLPDVEWAIIGHLQTNKARHVAAFAHAFHALDRVKVAEVLQRRLEGEDRTLEVFVQVNTSGEESKFGLHPDDLLDTLRALQPFDRLRVRGLMTLALFSSDMDRVRPCFRLLADLRERARQLALPGMSFDDLSMGMSGDFEVAIEEGATVVRVGQSLFGSRTSPHDYWPRSGL